MFALLHERRKKKRSATSVPMKTYPWSTTHAWVHTNLSRGNEAPTNERRFQWSHTGYGCVASNPNPSTPNLPTVGHG
ncbi:MAG: hypothetical protein IPK82_00135 [Polyangiaceae bacterium]|nr:hypothetical protein [Polyangiaceae bacterium]